MITVEERVVAYIEAIEQTDLKSNGTDWSAEENEEETESDSSEERYFCINQLIMMGEAETHIPYFIIHIMLTAIISHSFLPDICLASLRGLLFLICWNFSNDAIDHFIAASRPVA